MIYNSHCSNASFFLPPNEEFSKKNLFIRPFKKLLYLKNIYTISFGWLNRLAEYVSTIYNLSLVYKRVVPFK